MTRYAVLFALSLVVTAPAYACGMYIPRGDLGVVMGSIDHAPSAQEVARMKAEQERQARLAVNWIDEVGEVPRGSLPKVRSRPAERVVPTADQRPAPRVLHPQAAARTVERPKATPRVATASIAPSSSMESVRAFLNRWLEPEDAAAGDTADTAAVDTGLPE